VFTAEPTGNLPGEGTFRREAIILDNKTGKTRVWLTVKRIPSETVRWAGYARENCNRQTRFESDFASMWLQKHHLLLEKQLCALSNRYAAHPELTVGRMESNMTGIPFRREKEPGP
jgi:hypothetical protein